MRSGLETGGKPLTLTMLGKPVAQFYKGGFIISNWEAPVEKKEKKPDLQGDKKSKPEEDKDGIDLGTDLKTVLAKTASNRQKWLMAALRAAKDPKVKISLTALFDILAHRKFPSGVPVGMCRNMRNEIRKYTSVFSAKQQGFLRGDQWALSSACGREEPLYTRQYEEAKPPQEEEEEEDEQADEPRPKMSFSMAAGSSSDAPAPPPPEAPPPPLPGMGDKPPVVLPPKPAVTVAKPVVTVAKPPLTVAKPPARTLPPPITTQPKKPQAAALAKAFANDDDDLVETQDKDLARWQSQHKANLPTPMVPGGKIKEPERPREKEKKKRSKGDRSRSRSRDRDRRNVQRSRSRDRDRRKAKDGVHQDFSMAAFQARQAALDRLAPHEGLDLFKAEYLQSRGMKEGKRKRPKREVPFAD